jgi:hypothetical protein
MLLGYSASEHHEVALTGVSLDGGEGRQLRGNGRQFGRNAVASGQELLQLQLGLLADHPATRLFVQH